MTFPLEPDAIGEFAYTISIAPRLGEALTDNNRVDFPLSVVRDKIRVLLVCGSPTWNYRFLRQALKLDPSIDLLSFVILRTANDVVNVPESQLSLIPFPTERLFTRELRNFDLIIFENFDSRRYFPVAYLQNVARYVRDGGAFAMIGGPLAFSQGGYLGTPIEAILPVSLLRERRDYQQTTHQLRLTDEGRTHPITRLSSDDRENQRIWESMPELDALNLVGRPKPGATVLAVTSASSERRPRRAAAGHAAGRRGPHPGADDRLHLEVEFPARRAHGLQPALPAIYPPDGALAHPRPGAETGSQHGRRPRVSRRQRRDRPVPGVAG